MYRRCFNAILLLNAIILLNCCTTQNSQDPYVYSDALFVLKSAFNVKYANLKGTQQVVYSVIEQYPALNVISQIDDKLQSMGWRPLEKDWLNPQVPTSHVRGWTDYIDETKNNNKEVHSWYSNWINPQEDMLIYSLEYSRPVKSESIMSDLKIVAIYIPEKLAKERISQVGSYKKP